LSVEVDQWRVMEKSSEVVVLMVGVVGGVASRVEI
jgi:hypothetical protein